MNCLNSRKGIFLEYPADLNVTEKLIKVAKNKLETSLEQGEILLFPLFEINKRELK